MHIRIGWVLSPNPKVSDLSICDHWRGIARLIIVEKLFGRVLQNRLQVLAEDVLHESQCGLRRGRSCTDMTTIIIVRQVVEKYYEHRTKSFLIMR